MQINDKLRSESQYIVTVSVPRASLIRPLELMNLLNRVEKNLRHGLNDLENDYKLQYKLQYDHDQKSAEIYIKTSLLDRKLTPQIIIEYLNKYFGGFWYSWIWNGKVRFKRIEKAQGPDFEEIEEDKSTKEELEEAAKVIFCILLLITILYALNTVRGAVS